MLSRLFRKWLAHLPYFDVGDGRGDTFFRRYDVIKTRWGGVYLHEFFRSDNCRCLHNHPWSFLTIVLRGGYWEEVFDYRPEAGGPFVCNGSECDLSPTMRHWRRPGFVRHYPACHSHRIEIEPGSRPWSLVFVGRKTPGWGFWTPDGFLPWSKGNPDPICETK